MAKTLVQIPFAGGIDERTDPRHVLPGKLTSLRNGVFSRNGSIVKRQGTSLLPSTVTASHALGFASVPAALGEIRKLAAFDSELLASDGSRLYSYDEGGGEWTSKDALPQATAERASVAHGSAFILAPDVAYGNGYLIYVWSEEHIATKGTASVAVTVIHQATGSQVYSDYRLSAIGSALPPRVCVIGTTAIVFWMDAAGVGKVRTLDLTNPVAWTVEQGVLADGLAASTVHYDISAAGGYLYVAYDRGGASPRIKVRLLDPSGLFATLASTTIANGTAASSMTLHATAGETVWVAWIREAAPNVIVEAIGLSTATLAPTVATTVVDSVATTGYYDTIGVVRVSPARCVVAWQMLDTVDTSVPIAKWRQVSTSAATVGPVHWTHRLMWGSRPFVQDGRTFAMVYYRHSSFVESTQCTAYLVDLQTDDITTTTVTAHPVTTVAPRRASTVGIYDIRAKLSQAARVDATMVAIPTVVKRSAAGKVAIDGCVFDFADTAAHSSASVGGTLHLSGGVPCAYDFARVFESAFMIIPEAPTVTQTPTGGAVPDGTYGYALVLARYDNAGQICRSAPAYFTVVAAGGPNRIDMDVPQVALMRVQDVECDYEPACFWELYRTVAGGTTYFKCPDATVTDVASIAGPVANLPWLSTVEIRDSTLDAALAGQPLLYTTGGVLENRSAPSARLVLAHRGRVWLAGTDDPKTIWYSPQYVLGEGRGFHEQLTLTIEDGGGITAIGSMDGNLIVFKRERVYVVAGDGPPLTGGSGNELNVQRIASDLGCIEPRSVAVMPEGMVFQSTAGIYLLDRSFSVKLLSAPVFTTLLEFPEITSATVHESEFQVRWSCRGSEGQGGVLVWDYRVNEWSVFTYPFAPATACSWRGAYTIGSAGGIVLTESGASWLDAGAWVSVQIQTSWLKVGGLQGYQRAFTVQLLGERHGSHDVRLETSFDYAADAADAYRWTAKKIDAMPLEVLERGIKRPKCTAIQFRITDLPPSDGASIGDGHGASWTGMALEVNQLPRRRPLPPNQRA